MYYTLTHFQAKLNSFEEQLEVLNKELEKALDQDYQLLGMKSRKQGPYQDFLDCKESMFC